VAFEIRPAGDLSLFSRAGDDRLGTGALVCLSGLGLAAAATILAFFGTGFLLLHEHPVAIVRSGSLRGLSAPGWPATLMGGTASSPSIPVRQRGMTASAEQPDGMGTPGVPKREPATSSVSSNHTTLNPTPAATRPGARPEAATTALDPHGTTATPPMQPGLPDVRSPSPNLPLRTIANLFDAAEARSTAVAEPGANAPLSAAEIRALLTQGDAAFRRGDLTSARLLYRRAFEAGDGHGALGIGASYDPLFLRHLHLWTQPSDPDMARSWYLRARDLGVREAEGRLDRLKGKPLQ
jgi:hypothetical protein